MRRQRQNQSSLPFGIGAQKPRHYLEMAKILWDNKSELGYAYRVLTQGVCDGCALGTTGLSDWTLEGTHLCLSRLNLLRLNTLPGFDAAGLERVRDAAALRGLDARALRAIGRIPFPLRRLRGEPGFTRVSWDEALRDLGTRLRATDPDRAACYMTARGITNEVYYAAQKAWRRFGSPHIDNAARLCHAPSTAAMKRVLGVSASTCSYKDWYGTDLVVLCGANPANDQPVAIKYLIEAKRLGTRVLVVNPFREPGLERYWVPSDAGSAFFGSQIADRFFSVAPGGDQAFYYAVQQLIIDRHAEDKQFIANHTSGWDAYRAQIKRFSFDDLVRRAGSTREAVIEFADALCRAKSAVFVWSMGLTQHAHGTHTVEALLCLGLSRGFIGREHTGLMPIRGHSGVQGGAEMGAYANVFPGGQAITPENAQALASVWGFSPPAREGMHTAAMLAAASQQRLDLLYAIGGNFVDTMPDPAAIERALAEIPVRIHQDIVLNHAMLVEPRDVVYLLPAKTRYESAGGVTETTTERRVVFSPYIPGHEVGEAREEWKIPLELVRAARPELADSLQFRDAAAIRSEIARCIESYRGIEKLEKQGDSFQWGGPRLCEGGQFPLPGGRARFVVAEREPYDARLPEGKFRLTTRRGKQWNSIVQADVDGLTGAARDHVLISDADLTRLGVEHGGRIRVRNSQGSFEGRAFRAELNPGHVQMHWPEANVLIPADRADPQSHVPDYNATVELEAMP
jgi:molybdopterin-dependent oxidoreductase alpha subunit